MARLIVDSSLQRNVLDEGHYAEALLEAAARLDLLGDADIARLQDAFHRLLTAQCRAYTGGASRSIRAETARSLAESVWFTIDLRLKQFPNPIDALAMLQNRALDSIFQEGRALVDAQVRSAELFYRLERARMYRTGSKCFDSTFFDGFPAFFARYNPAYGAHDRILTADYPVIFEPRGLRGIEFIRGYLDAWQTENRLLRLFPAASVRRCASLYALANDLTLSDLCENLCEITLAAALPSGADQAAGKRLTDKLGCPPPLCAFVARVCRERRGNLDRIRAFMRGA